MEDKLITLKNYETIVEALFDQEILRENNIDCSINNEGAVELLPMFGEVNDGIRILVFENDLIKAIKILDEYENEIEKTPVSEEE